MKNQKRKPIYVTMTAQEGNPENIVTDMPERKPTRAAFDHYAVFQGESNAYQVHLLTKGMPFDQQQAGAWVTILMIDPIVRTGTIKRPRGLPWDHLQSDVLLISDDPSEDFYTVLEGKTDKGGIRIDHELRDSDRVKYPLEMILETFKQAGFELYEVPQVEGTTIRGLVLKHRTVKLPFNDLAGTLIDYIQERA